MWHWLSICVISGLVSVLAGNEGTGPEPARKELFNGRNLDGWRYYLDDHLVGMEDVWSVRDGLLVCKGEPMGYLYTAAGYRNFRLRVEWRWAPGAAPGNSGVLLRINGPPRPLPRCYEAQLKHGDAGDMYGFHAMPLKGDAARMRHVEDHPLGGKLAGIGHIANHEKPAGQWNVYDIHVEGPRITLRINGELVNEGWDTEVLAGPVGLQSEGGEIHFRKVTVTPLPD